MRPTLLKCMPDAHITFIRECYSNGRSLLTEPTVGGLLAPLPPAGGQTVPVRWTGTGARPASVLLCWFTTNRGACAVVVVVVSLPQFKAKRLLFNHAMDVLLRLAREEGSCLRIESPYLATIHGEKQYATAHRHLNH